MISGGKLFLMNECRNFPVNRKDGLSFLSIVCNIKWTMNVSSIFLFSSGAGIQSIIYPYSDSEIHCWYKQPLRSFSEDSFWTILLLKGVVLFFQPSQLKLFNGTSAANISVGFIPFPSLSPDSGTVPGLHFMLTQQCVHGPFCLRKPWG